ncbi:MAG: M16 family metallopeptidase, partial [Polyangiaceae bacterium]
MTTRFEVGGAVVFLEESHALPLVSITILSKCGAAHDLPGKTGLARVTTRLMLRGVEGLSATEIEERLDLLGAEAGEETTAASTCIQAQGIARNIDELADLLAKIVGAPALAEDELARLIREMDAEQLEQRDDDRTLAVRALRRAVFGDHIYGRVTTRDSLSKMIVDDVRGFHSRFYTRKNMVVSIAGDVTPDHAHALADRILSRVPPGDAVSDPTPEPAKKIGRHLFFVDKPERTQTQILMGALGTSPHDPDHFDLVVGDAVLGGSFTSRLMREVRSKRGWSYG